MPPANPTAVQEANATIRSGMEARGAGASVVPFDRQTPDDLRPDGVHMEDTGQEHRAALAFPVLGW